MAITPALETRKMTRSDLLALSAAAGLLLVFASTSAHPKPDLLGFLVPAAFALAAWILQGVNLSGALAGASIAFIFYGIGGWRLFLVLLVVFAITLLATQAGAIRKRKSLPMERGPGRSASQVMANLFVPTAVLLLPRSIAPTAIFMGATFAALAELAADTVSSEVGEAFGHPTYLITTWKRADSGTNGGVSFLGTFAGVAAALLATACGWILGLSDMRFWIAALAGVLGMLADSLLGATLENRGVLKNDAVNLISTAVAAGIGAMLFIRVELSN